MMKRLFTFLLFSLFALHVAAQEQIKPEIISKAISNLEQLYGKSERINKGVESVAKQWCEYENSEEDFLEFVEKQYVNDSKELYDLAITVSDNLRIINGHVWAIGSTLSNPFNADTGEITEVQRIFNDFNLGANINKQLFKSKIAFLVLLNFPPFTKEEKEAKGEGWDSTEWGYALLGDMFKKDDKKEDKKDKEDGDEKEEDSLMKPYEGSSKLYADNSVLPLLSIKGKKGEDLFTEDKHLLFHWRMRDEIKNLYGSSNPNKLDQQKAIYRAMERYIDQTLPAQLMEKDGYAWNPYTNEISLDGAKVEAESAENLRYEYLRNLYIRKSKEQPDSTLYFDNYFDSYGVKASVIEDILVRLISSDQMKEVGALVKKRLGRKLEPFDVWYTGFDNRSNYDAKELDDMMKNRFPTPKAFEEAIAETLGMLGFSDELAQYYQSKITVEATRANGHAAGATLRNEKAHLRTNFDADGMDFGGYQVGMHELGHTLQQTISTHDIDIFPRRSLPNTGIVESAAYIFQFRAWEAVPGVDVTAKMRSDKVLDKFWGTTEIAGPALWEIRIWQWMYNKKVFTASELKDQSLVIAKDIWNEFYAPIFGTKDAIMGATYNHTLNSSLYVSGYALAHIIHMQIEEHIKGKELSSEFKRIFELGNLPAKIWMQRAINQDLSVEPMLNAVNEALK